MDLFHSMTFCKCFSFTGTDCNLSCFLLFYSFFIIIIYKFMLPEVDYSVGLMLTSELTKSDVPFELGV